MVLNYVEGQSESDIELPYSQEKHKYGDPTFPPLNLCQTLGSKSLAFFIILVFRVIVLGVVFAFWALNILLLWSNIGRGYVPPENSEVWNTLQKNNASMLLQFFFPLNPHPAIHSGTYVQYFFCISACAYTAELVISSPFAIYAVLIARKSLELSRKNLVEWVILMFIHLAAYSMGAVNFFMSQNFVMAYWADLALVTLLILLAIFRIQWINYLLRMGFRDTQLSTFAGKVGNFDGEKVIQNEEMHRTEAEHDIKKDPDYLNLFGPGSEHPSDHLLKHNERGDAHGGLGPAHLTTTESSVPSSVPSATGIHDPTMTNTTHTTPHVFIPKDSSHAKKGGGHTEKEHEYKHEHGHHGHDEHGHDDHHDHSKHHGQPSRHHQPHNKQTNKSVHHHQMHKR